MQWKILNQADGYIELQSEDGWFRAHVKYDGCFELYRVFNYPFTDEMTIEQAEDDPRMLLSQMHICDVDDLIEKLNKIKKIGVDKFGEDFR